MTTTTNPLNASNDQLLTHLIEFERELEKAGIPLILGGGMSLYVRTQYLRVQASTRYPFTIETRSTNDLDLFLSASLIVDTKRVAKLREIIDSLGYTVDQNARNFQFSKDVKIYGQLRQVRIELLAAPPADADYEKVEIKEPRIKPVGVEGIHAYLTKAARGIEIGVARIAIPADADGQVTVTIPSAYNYLILKLHAFDDRKYKKDAKSDEGRHHAYDIFATATRMNEEDWTIAAEHRKSQSESAYLQNAVRIRRECFASRTSIGLLRIQENAGYRREREVYNEYLDFFVRDLEELFP